MSNREEIERNNWLGVGYNHGDTNTSDGLTEILSSVDLRNPLETIFPNSCEWAEEGNREKDHIIETIYCLSWNYSGGGGFGH